MILSHYSYAEGIAPESRDQDENPYSKPRGFWVSVDGEDDWPSWCASEEFRDTGAQHHHRVTLADGARVLVVDSVSALDDFTERYGVPDHRFSVRPSKGDGIDWVAVAEDWQGIIIAPYQWECRLTLSWYYTWDCASGCIWDADAIASVEPVVIEAVAA